MTKKNDPSISGLNEMFKRAYGPVIKRMFGESYTLINITELDPVFKKNELLGNLVLLNNSDKINLPNQIDALDEFKSYPVECASNLFLFEDQAKIILEVLGWSDVVENCKIIPRNENTEILFG